MKDIKDMNKNERNLYDAIYNFIFDEMMDGKSLGEADRDLLKFFHEAESEIRYSIYNEYIND